MPKACCKQSSRKEIGDEIALAMAKQQIATLKADWDADRAVEGGAIPDYGATDTALMFRLLNRYAVLNRSLAIADKKLRRGKFERRPGTCGSLREALWFAPSTTN